eukprot:SM000016S01825  [mRNA]  locus=s16:22618:27177:- [translate_table: standard]
MMAAAAPMPTIGDDLGPEYVDDAPVLPRRRAGVPLPQPRSSSAQPSWLSFGAAGCRAAHLRRNRNAGILLHPTSFPGPYGIGDLGPEAFKFIDWLQSTRCCVWQVLPLVPPGRKSGEDGSPYAGQDANCGNTLLISPDLLVEDGLLSKSDLPAPIAVERVDYDNVAKVKDVLVAKAAKKLVSSEGPLKEDFLDFRKRPSISGWLEEAALFAAIDCVHDAVCWWEWPEELRDRKPEALKKAREDHTAFITEFVAQQYIFQRQWESLHKYASSRGIRIVGDMPIYVGGHSADVWANRDQFMLVGIPCPKRNMSSKGRCDICGHRYLDCMKGGLLNASRMWLLIGVSLVVANQDEATGAPAFVSGVPPDAFSETGQLWGSPLYNWKVMKEDGYKWWVQRMKRAFTLYDEFRIDHFRGLAGYWSIPADAETAMSGVWKVGPREDFFAAIKDAVGKVDIIAEDLGVITKDVTQLREAIGAPGMAVLLFGNPAFGGDPSNPHIPHNHEVNQVVYPGTHDNDTVLGWWKKAPQDEKKQTLEYLRTAEGADISWEFIKAAVQSVPRTAIFSLQDIMSLDNSARMNTPAVKAGNWGWRLGCQGTADSFDALEEHAKNLADMLSTYNRAPPVVNLAAS